MAPKRKSKAKHSKKKRCACRSQVQTTRVSVGGGGLAAPPPSVITYATFANPLPQQTFPTWETGPGVAPVHQEPSTGASVSSRRPTRDDGHYGPFTGGGVLGGWLNDLDAASSMQTSSFKPVKSEIKSEQMPDVKSETMSVKSEKMSEVLSNTPSRVSDDGVSLTDSHLRVLDRLHREADILKPRSIRGTSAIEGVRDAPSVISHAESDSPAASVKTLSSKSSSSSRSSASALTRMSTGSRTAGSKLASLLDDLNM